MEGARRASGTWVFKDVEYFLSSCVSEEWLEVAVEETGSGDTWKGKFEAKRVEELTRKTGNYKQFVVFTTMLESAINKSSECVTLDLLTYTDLESLRDRRNAARSSAREEGGERGHREGGGGRESQTLMAGAPSSLSQKVPDKRYLILTYSVEFDRIHYPLALSFAGQADSGHLKQTVSRLTAELERYKREGKKGSTLARLQKDYDALLREKEELEEAVETLQAQLVEVRGTKEERKQLRMLQEVIRNLEEELLQERSKHQRYVSKKTEELRALTQELGELRSSERTLRSRVKNLTSELAFLKKGVRSSPSGCLRQRQTPPSSSSKHSLFKKTPSSGSFKKTPSSGSFKKTPSSGSGTGGGRQRERGRRSHSGSLERGKERLERGRERVGSHERRLALGMSGSRMRTPSPRGVIGGRWMRFDPSAYVENKRQQQKENEERFRRLRSPSYHGSVTHSRSSSLDKVQQHRRSGSNGSVGRPPVQLRSGSRRLWGSTSERYKGSRARSSSLGSLSARSSRDSSPASSRGGSHHRPSLSDLDPSPPSSLRDRPTRQTSSNRNKRKRLSGGGSDRCRTSTPTSSVGKAGKRRNSGGGGTLLDHSAEMSEIDARLNALQQFMKRSLEATKAKHYRR